MDMRERNADDDQAPDFDSPWKEAIGTYFRPFMALFFPAVQELVDWSRPYEFLDAELQRITGDSDLGRRYADRLVKVYRVGGAEIWLLIHIEVQGRADARFQARMFQYYYRIYDRYGEMEIVSLAVVTNERPGADLDIYRQERDGYGLRFRFRVRGLRDWQEEELVTLAVTNPFAVVALAQLAAHRRSSNPGRKARKREIIELLYRYRYLDFARKTPFFRAGMQSALRKARSLWGALLLNVLAQDVDGRTAARSRKVTR